MTRRALVLDTGKRMLDEACAPLADRVGFVPIRAGQHVAAFEPDPRTLRAVDAIMARTPFRHVVASSESNLAFAAYLRCRYGLDGMTVDDATAATNKWRMKQRIGTALPTARCWLPADFAALDPRHRPAEVVLKPLAGSSSKGVRRLSTSDALAQLSEVEELLLVEAAVDVERELHCDGVVRGDELLVALPSAYDRPVLGAAGTTRASIHLPRTDPAAGDVVAAASTALVAFGVRDTVFHLELFASRGELLFGEIGLRPAGGGVAESLRLFTGVDIWSEFVLLQLGEPAGVEHAVPAAERGYRGVSGVVAAGSAVTAEELAEVAGVVRVAPGSPRAGEAHGGSSCAFDHLAFFHVEHEAQAHATIAHLATVARGAVGVSR